MHLCELRDLVSSTSDAAFVLNSETGVVAWNAGAEAFFGVPPTDALGQDCADLVGGCDENGPVCSHHCRIKQALQEHRRVNNFDMQVNTPRGKIWCTACVLFAASDDLDHSLLVHIILPYKICMRTMPVADFNQAWSRHERGRGDALLTQQQNTAQSLYLSPRQQEILVLVADGLSSREIAKQVHTAPKTVENHLRAVYRRLNVHKRLDAIRYARRAGLI